MAKLEFCSSEMGSHWRPLSNGLWREQSGGEEARWEPTAGIQLGDLVV